MNRIVFPLLLGLLLAATPCWPAEPKAAGPVDQAKAIPKVEKLGGKGATDDKSPTAGDLALLEQIQVAHDTNRDAVLTWEGDVSVQSHTQRGATVDDRVCKAAFAFDRLQAAWFFHWIYVKAANGSWPDGAHTGGMLKDKAWYSYQPVVPGGRVMQGVTIMVGPPPRVGPMTESFHPMYYFTANGQDLRSEFANWRKLAAAAPDWFRLTIKREGPLATITPGNTRIPDATQHFAFDLSKGGNVVSVGGRDTAREESWDVAWEERSGVWVPKRVCYRNIRHDGSEVLKSTIIWQRSEVNKGIAAERFNLSAMGVMPGAIIQDRRTHQKVPHAAAVGKIGIDGRVAAPLPEPHVSAVPSSKSIKTTLTAEMARLVESMAENASSARTGSDQLRVAVFSMIEGDPAETLVTLLESKLKCKSRTVTAKEIRADALKEFDVVLFPGGSGKAQAQELQTEGQQAVQQFVKDGGGYVGICAGAFLASCREGVYLNLINVRPLTGKKEAAGPDGKESVDMAARGGGILKIELTDAGSKILGAQSGLVDTDYSGGPVFSPAGRSDLPECVSLAFYRTEIWVHELQRGTMVDTPAILAAPFGKGRVIIFSPHPEVSDPKMTSGLESFVTRAVLATARKDH